MKHIQKTEIYVPKSDLDTKIFRENCMFFDIETTGFSSSNSMIYLIGCLRRNGDTIFIDQFFAESRHDEKELLLAFLDLLKDKDTILSFNGIGFDIPFIAGRCAKYHIEEHLKDFNHFDIYKQVCNMKFLLKLPNYKQKSIETFLGIHREDTFSGGELIEVYEDYLATHNEEEEKFLLLHNFEDVLGMLELLPILTYSEILNGAYRVCDTELLSYTSFEGSCGQELIISITTDYPVPKAASCPKDGFYLTLNGNTGKLRIPVYEGELKYFYPNYKDYFYLPKEDMAIHKSVADFVDKEFKEKAKACNCYTKRSGMFVPQLRPLIQPQFCENHKDKTTYFELNDTFTDSKEQLYDYVNHIFMFFLSSKKR